MNSTDKGFIGEQKVKADLAQKGFKFATPDGHALPFDLICIDSQYNLLKIQIKYSKLKEGKVTLSFRTGHQNSKKTYIRNYTSEQVDIFAVYVPELDKCFYIDSQMMKLHKNAITLRTVKTKNNQIKNVKYLSDFENFPWSG